MSSNNRHWLIRHPDYSFSRPLSEEELMKVFGEGSMQPRDEIAPSSGYWFSLQDVHEMRKHFGNIPMDGLFKRVKEEITQERYVITAPMVTKILHSPAVEESLAEDSLRHASPLMKGMLIILTLVVIALLFVWFG